jgi:aldehyde dehydrogenase (NAD+)
MDRFKFKFFALTLRFDLNRSKGGKSPLVIMDDVNVDEAVQIAHFAVLFNQGQVCCAASRTYVHENIYDEFVRKSVQLAKARKVGSCFSCLENVN